MLQLLKAKDAAVILGVAPATLRDYRRRGLDEADRAWLKKDIHYITRGQNVVRYIKEAIEHWAVNDEDTHNKWIKSQVTSSHGRRPRSA